MYVSHGLHYLKKPGLFQNKIQTWFFLIVLPAPPGLSSGIPNPIARHNPSSLFYVYLQVSDVLDAPRKPSKRCQPPARRQSGIPTQQTSPPIWYLRLWRGAGERPQMSSFHLYQGESFLKPETTGEKCLLCLVNQKLPSWERNICSVFFFHHFHYTQSSNVCFSPAISLLPLIHQVIYSYIYLKHRSIAYDPCAPSSGFLFWDGAQAVPQLQVRVYMGSGRGGGVHFIME